MPTPDPADKQLDATADGAFGGKPTVGSDCAPNRRAGYGDQLTMIDRIARKGGTLAAGEGAKLIAYYEAQLARVVELAAAALTLVGEAYAEGARAESPWLASHACGVAVTLQLQLDRLRAGASETGSA